MLNELLQALALVMVVEGIVPFLAPRNWKHYMQQIAGLSEQAIRIVGLVSMLLGVALLYVINE